MFFELLAPNSGFASLFLIATLGLLTPLINYIFYNKNTKLDNIASLSKKISIIIFISAIICQLSLTYSFIISDYSVSNVYYNSHHLKPLIYKISGSWGNHEGSMLLLILIIAGFSLFFNIFSNADNKYKILVQSSQSLIVGLFASYTALSSNPFERIFPEPNYGLELNPLLQDIGLAFHPPMLYIGYLGFSLVFSIAVAALLLEKIDKNFAKIIKNWLYFSWSFLTLGIGLGSWWAYRELGWGGFWFWDPVENVSLMPWLSGVILIHCLMMLEKKEAFPIWAVFLSIISFLLCLLGIFLVRSGVLTSVHSFAVDTERGFFIIGLISIIGILSLTIFSIKSSKIKKKKFILKIFTKGGSILINNYILIVALFVVVLATIYPIFSQLFFDQFISIGPDYYNQIFKILIIPFLFFMALSNLQNFKENLKFRDFIDIKVGLIAALSLSFSFLSFFSENKIGLVNFIIIFLTFQVIFSTIFLNKNYRNLSNFVHIGFALIILGILTATNFSQTKEINLKEGDNFKIANFDLKFSSVNFVNGGNYIARQGNFEVKTVDNKEDKSLFTLKPQLRYYPVADQTTNEADIKTNFIGDLYIVIGNKDEDNNYAVRLYFKPFIYLIWIGCFVIFISVMYFLFLKISKVYLRY